MAERVRVTDSWHLGGRQRIAALAEAERRVAGENVRLFQELGELERRVDRVRQLCERYYDTSWAREVERLLDGDTT